VYRARICKVETEALTENKVQIEKRAEQLALQLARLLNEIEGPEREAVRELLVERLREETEPIEPMSPRAQPRSADFNPLGIGIPVFLMGTVMLVVFPPVGLLLLVAAAVLVVWGLLVTLVARPTVG